jgi:ATP-dependent protease HslVU (ClpYQ) peptidase subunit
MEILDPKVALVTGVGAAVIGSESVRRAIGRGAGYAVAGASKVASPVVNAGREIVGEAREVAGTDKARSGSGART